jgi:hypothetical protein
MIYIGCDPGKNGGLAILQGEEVQTFRYDRDTYRCVLSDLRGEKAVCCLEHVGVMPKNGSVSMFHFGENFGWLQGMLEEDALSCDNCKWLGKRYQKCSCCLRNHGIKDNYEGKTP